uniref:Uncharacterized protein n=1 Tax=Lates calcarifer TaxID=8187 RepID=A0A4W6DK45_LATCA
MGYVNSKCTASPLLSPLLSSPLRNYGGVYVGLPADLTTVAGSQSKSTRKGNASLTL